MLDLILIMLVININNINNVPLSCSGSQDCLQPISIMLGLMHLFFKSFVYRRKFSRYFVTPGTVDYETMFK